LPDFQKISRKYECLPIKQNAIINPSGQNFKNGSVLGWESQRSMLCWEGMITLSLISVHLDKFINYSGIPELFIFKLKIKGHVNDLRKSVHVPDFSTYSTNCFKKKVCL